MMSDRTLDEPRASEAEDSPPAVTSGDASRRSGLAGMLSTQRTRLIAVVLAAALLIGFGYAAGRLSPLFTAPGDDSPEAGFARDMSVHHAQAVHMSLVEYDRGENSSIRRLAYDIATSQQYQIGQMETWLQEWHLPLTTDRPPMAWMPASERQLQADGRMPGLASTDELRRLEAASGHDADVLFCQLMLRHHLGGIHMADAVLALTDDDRVVDMATRMRNTQSGEVEALRLSLRNLGAEPA
jgi:uncharacterized protein (DUF305 family)